MTPEEGSLLPFILLALKEKGNEAFVKGDYETAILCYSEGLGKLKDMKELYTNRAQVGDPHWGPQWRLREQVPSLSKQRRRSAVSLVGWCLPTSSWGFMLRVPVSMAEILAVISLQSPA